MTRILLISGLVAASASAGTFGSLRWTDIDELVAGNKSAFARVLADFDVTCVGDARMINRAENVKLNGARIGPYNFPAKPKGASDAYCYTLHIETQPTFVDAAGKAVTLARATDFHEVVTGVTLRPEPPEKCFVPAPDQCP